MTYWSSPNTPVSSEAFAKSVKGFAQLRALDDATIDSLPAAELRSRVLASVREMHQADATFRTLSGYDMEDIRTDFRSDTLPNPNSTAEATAMFKGARKAIIGMVDAMEACAPGQSETRKALVFALQGVMIKAAHIGRELGEYLEPSLAGTKIELSSTLRA